MSTWYYGPKRNIDVTDLTEGFYNNLPCNAGTVKYCTSNSELASECKRNGVMDRCRPFFRASAYAGKDVWDTEDLFHSLIGAGESDEAARMLDATDKSTGEPLVTIDKLSKGFHEALRANNDRIFWLLVERMIERGFDFNYYTTRERSLRKAFGECTNSKIYSFLKMDFIDRGFVHHIAENAAFSGNVPLVEYIVREKEYPAYNIMILAVEGKQVEVMRLLLSFSDIEYNDKAAIIRLIFEGNQVDMLRLVLTSSDIRFDDPAPILERILKGNHVDMARVLVETKPLVFLSEFGKYIRLAHDRGLTELLYALTGG